LQTIFLIFLFFHSFS